MLGRVLLVQRVLNDCQHQHQRYGTHLDRHVATHPLGALVVLGRLVGPELFALPHGEVATAEQSRVSSSVSEQQWQ